MLWILRNGPTCIEARLRTTPLGPQLQFSMSASGSVPTHAGPPHAPLLGAHAQSLALATLAEHLLRDLLEQGWRLDDLAMAAHIENAVGKGSS